MTLIRAAHPSLPRAWTPVRRLDEGACAEEGCPCEWRDGLELLCGVRCDPPTTRVWCGKYGDDAAACGNAYAQRANGSYGRCEHDGESCTLQNVYECSEPPPSASPSPPPPPSA